MTSWIRLVVLAALVTAAGCATEMSSDEFAQRTRELEYNTVVFTDYDLNRRFSEYLMGPDQVIRITADKHGIRRTPTGTAQVWAELRNHTDYDYVVEARTRFYASDGMPVDTDPVWKRLTVSANAVTTYKEKSISTGELQYRVEVRQAK